MTPLPLLTGALSLMGCAADYSYDPSDYTADTYYADGDEPDYDDGPSEVEDDFLSLTPESIHQVTILFSDRGTPRTYRHMNGYGSHSYAFINEKGKRFWVKFHFKTMQGIQCLTDDEAAAIVAGDRESHQRDL